MVDDDLSQNHREGPQIPNRVLRHARSIDPKVGRYGFALEGNARKGLRYGLHPSCPGKDSQQVVSARDPNSGQVSYIHVTPMLTTQNVKDPNTKTQDTIQRLRDRSLMQTGSVFNLPERSGYMGVQPRAILRYHP